MSVVAAWQLNIINFNIKKLTLRLIVAKYVII